MLKRLTTDSVRLVECPFCGADLEGASPAVHLEQCREFYEANGKEAPNGVGDRAATDGGRSSAGGNADVAESLSRAKDAGTWVGRPPAGFRAVDGELRVAPEEFEAIAEAFERIGAGESQRSVSRDVDAIHASTLRRLWRDENRRAIYTEYSAEDEQIQAALDDWLENLEKSAAELRAGAE